VHHSSIPLTVSPRVKVQSAAPQYGDLNALFLYDKSVINICYVKIILKATNKDKSGLI
jgi:hypothetical protein